MRHEVLCLKRVDLEISVRAEIEIIINSTIGKTGNTAQMRKKSMHLPGAEFGEILDEDVGSGELRYDVLFRELLHIVKAILTWFDCQDSLTASTLIMTYLIGEAVHRLWRAAHPYLWHVRATRSKGSEV